MNRPIMKEHYQNPDILTKNIIDIINQPQEVTAQETEQKANAVKLYNQAISKVDARTAGKKVKFTDEELASRLDASSLQEGHLYRQQEALNAYTQEKEDWNKIHESREKAINHNYEKSM